MKRIKLFTASAILATGLLGACQSGPATLSGEVKGYKGGAIECMLLSENGVQNDSVSINEDGTFTYIHDYPNGQEIWLVAEDAKGFVRLYMKNGNKQHVVLSASADSINGRCDVVYSGDSKPSEFLGEYDKEFGYYGKWALDKADDYANFKDFQAELNGVVTRLETQLNGTGDKDFIAKQKKNIETQRTTLPFRFALGNKIASVSANTDKEFVDFAEKIDYNNMESAKNNLVDLYVSWYQSCHPDSQQGKGAQYFSILKQRVSDQSVIDFVADAYISRYIQDGADADLESTFEAYKQITKNQEKVKELMPKYEGLKKLLPGNIAPDFDLKDTAEKAVRFSEVIGKGKVVYLDIWATWCGPCCAEIPYMEKLAEHYKGNSKIEIMSISLDENLNNWKKKLEADRPAWKQFVTPNGLKSGLCKEYQITGIPRFMLFDKDGKIIDLNAPRPSDKEIINYLDRQLK